LTSLPVKRAPVPYRHYLVLSLRAGLSAIAMVVMATRQVAAAQVQRSLPPGWKATLTSGRLSRGRAAELEMRPNTVRKLTEAPSSQLFIGA
jgi:hypothetical protein